MAEQTFLPAARFKALTPYFDFFVRITTREPQFKQRLLDRLDIRPGERVLDLGVGTATLAILIKQRHPDASVVGLDADPQILDIARRKIAAAGAEVELVEAYSNAMPFEDASIDVVVSTLFFHHISGQVKRETLGEVKRVLKPGGRLYVGDWGKPKDPLQELLFLPARAFDGFEVTADNRRGALPRLFMEAGLGEVAHDGDLRTAFGTLAFYSARN